MKIQLASDLHLELRRGHQPEIHDFCPVADRDLLVLAGDIGTYMGAWAFIEQELRRSPVIYVPGNHEYYSWQTREHIDEAWQLKAQQIPDLHYLLCEGVTIGGVRFWGAPWYSDLFGRRDRGYLDLVAESINDFDRKFDDFGRWSVARHLDEHARQTRLLREQAGRVDVVVTHWPPTKHAVAPRFRGDALNGYFVNDREGLVREVGAQYWVSGHVHDPHECVIGTTRCIGNPTGYPRDFRRSPLHTPDRVIETRPMAARQETAAGLSL